jgi:hypothetical protein
MSIGRMWVARTRPSEEREDCNARPDETSSLPAPASAAGALSTWPSLVKALAHWTCTFCARAGAAAKVKSVTAKSTTTERPTRSPVLGVRKNGTLQQRRARVSTVSVSLESHAASTGGPVSDSSGPDGLDWPRADRAHVRVASPSSERSPRGELAPDCRGHISGQALNGHPQPPEICGPAQIELLRRQLMAGSGVQVAAGEHPSQQTLIR